MNAVREAELSLMDGRVFTREANEAMESEMVNGQPRQGRPRQGRPTSNDDRVSDEPRHPRRTNRATRPLAGALLALASLLMLSATAPVAATEPSPFGDLYETQHGMSESADVSERTEVPDNWRSVETENGWALPIEQLGWGSTLVATNDDTTFDLTVPNVAHHRLGSIEFTAELSPSVPEGHVIVSVDGDEVSTTLVEGNQPVPIGVDLPLVAAGSVVSIRIHPHHPDCPVGVTTTIARLTTPTLFFRSAPVSARSAEGTLITPDVVAGAQFIVDETRSAAAEQAVLSAASTMARQFPGEQRFAVATAGTTLDPAPPFVVRVRVSERDEAAITGDVENEQFIVTGRSDELIAQASGFVDALTTLDEIDQVVVSAVTTNDEASNNRRPIEDVTSRLRVSGAQHLELPIQLEQTDFGQPVTSYRLRVGGVASPTRSADATGIQLGLWVDDELLEVVELDENGRFDLETTIAGERVDRTAVVKLVLDLQVSGCPAGDSLGIQVDRGSWVEADYGQGLEPGFGRFPQVFGQSMTVDPGSTVSQLGAAADAVGLLQDTTTWHLQPLVADRADVATAGPALVVGADIELLDVLGSPVNSPSGRIETGNSTLASASDLDSTASVIQAFVSHQDADVLAIDAVSDDSFFGLPDGLSVHRFRQLGGSVAHLDSQGVIEVAGISVETSENHADVALAPLNGSEARHLNSTTTGMPRRELFALGLAASLMVAGLVLFGRRSVRAAARASVLSR